MVRDGCTVVIGGLIQEQLTNTTTAHPRAGQPAVGGFCFSADTTETTERQEVIVLITPRIVYEPGTCQEGDKAACEFHRRQGVYAEKMSPFGKRSIARRYYRLAEKAYAERRSRHGAVVCRDGGAVRSVGSRGASSLRSDIWQGKPAAGPLAADDDRPAPMARPAGDPLEGPEMAGWLIDDLKRDAGRRPDRPCRCTRCDPGQPGRHNATSSARGRLQ